jgi:hypothetical protein
MSWANIEDAEFHRKAMQKKNKKIARLESENRRLKDILQLALTQRDHPFDWESDAREALGTIIPKEGFVDDMDHFADEALGNPEGKELPTHEEMVGIYRDDWKPKTEGKEGR